MPDVRPIAQLIHANRGIAVMRILTGRWRTIAVVAAVVLTASLTYGDTQQAAGQPADLAALFAPGGLLQDRNGDGVIDFVNARLVMGERPGAAEVSAAANVFARLGFETMAMNLPIPAAAAAGATA